MLDKLYRETPSVRGRRPGTGEPAPLTLTAYATLGLLSGVKWYSPTETQARARTFLRHFYWTPALSHIRREFERLESLGLVESKESSAGRVKRTVRFRLTPAGLAEVQRWSEDADSFAFPVTKNPAVLRLWLGRRSDSPHAVLGVCEGQITFIKGLRDGVVEHIRQHELLLSGAGLDTSAEPDIDAARRTSQWQLEVLHYCLRAYDAELSNLEGLRAGLRRLDVTRS